MLLEHGSPKGREIPFGMVLAQIDDEVGGPARMGSIEDERRSAAGAAHACEHLLASLFDDVANNQRPGARTAPAIARVGVDAARGRVERIVHRGAGSCYGTQVGGAMIVEASASKARAEHAERAKGPSVPAGRNPHGPMPEPRPREIEAGGPHGGTVGQRNAVEGDVEALRCRHAYRIPGVRNMAKARFAKVDVEEPAAIGRVGRHEGAPDVASPEA